VTLRMVLNEISPGQHFLQLLAVHALPAGAIVSLTVAGSRVPNEVARLSFFFLSCRCFLLFFWAGLGGAGWGCYCWAL